MISIQQIRGLFLQILLFLYIRNIVSFDFELGDCLDLVVVTNFIIHLIRYQQKTVNQSTHPQD